MIIRKINGFVNLNILLLLLFFGFTAFFYNKAPDTTSYPPIFSKTFPLSTPLSFLASMLGMRRLAADLIWIQVLQYYGERERGAVEELKKRKHQKKESLKQSYSKLQSYWQQIIRFDPLFVNAYLIGPTTLGWNLKRYDEAIQLLNEGIKSVEEITDTLPDLDIKETDEKHPLIVGKFAYVEELKWKLYTLKSALIYLHKDELGQAATLLENIASRKDAPEELKIILAQIYEQQNHYKEALKLWRDVYASTDKINRKKSALNHIKRLSYIISSQ